MSYKCSSFIRLMLSLSLFQSVLLAQNTITLQAPSTPDSSFYDIAKIDENEFWICGENGILKSVDSFGMMKNIPDFPGKGINLLKIATLSDRILISSDNGIIYSYLQSSQSWATLQIPGLSNSAIYSMLPLGDSIIYACGGHKLIATGKRTIPFGFVFASKDRGESWYPVMKKWNRFFWDLTYDSENDEVIALGYGPFGSRLFTISKKEVHRTDFRSKYLLHDIEYSNQYGLIACGGKYKKTGAKGKIYCFNEHKAESFKTGGFIWSLILTPSINLLTAGPGNIHFRIAKDENWQSAQILSTGNFYQSVLISKNKVFIVGSAGLLVLIDLTDSL